MNLVRKITIHNLQSKVPVCKAKVKSVVSKTLVYLKVKKPLELNIYFVSDKKIRELNRRYLQEDCATDVVSFDVSANKKEILGDIVISTDTALFNARKFHTSLAYEICLYAVHGALHLLGYDDATAAQRARMHNKENKILKKFYT